MAKPLLGLVGVAMGTGTGSCLAWGTKGQGLQGWDHIQGLGLEGQGWLLGCRSSVTPKWQLSGGVHGHGPYPWPCGWCGHPVLERGHAVSSGVKAPSLSCH